MEIKDFEIMNKKMEELDIDTPHGLSHYLRSIPGIAFLALIDTAINECLTNKDLQELYISAPDRETKNRETKSRLCNLVLASLCVQTKGAMDMMAMFGMYRHDEKFE